MIIISLERHEPKLEVTVEPREHVDELFNLVARPGMIYGSELVKNVMHVDPEEPPSTLADGKRKYVHEIKTRQKRRWLVIVFVLVPTGVIASSSIILMLPHFIIAALMPRVLIFRIPAGPDLP